MHFLDATRFSTVISLLQANNAFSAITDPVTGRPIINFTDAALAECTRLSCSMQSIIYGGDVKSSSAVHPLATGIGTTSTDATRDWILQNVLQATDQFSRELATNMTNLSRYASIFFFLHVSCVLIHLYFFTWKLAMLVSCIYANVPLN